MSFSPQHGRVGVSFSPREGGRGIEGVGGDPVNWTFGTSRSAERSPERRPWAGALRLTEPLTPQAPRTFPRRMTP